MRSMALAVLLAVFLSVPVSSRLAAQIQPAAKSGGLPLSMGAGVSGYDMNWGSGIMYGGTIWADYEPSLFPGWLHGLGAEIEARDISLNRSSSQPSNLKEDTVGGGAIYSLDRYRTFRPYAKFLAFYGSMDFKRPNPAYTHDTGTVYAPGFGIDVHVFRSFWLRGDYEYQFWSILNTARNPRGVTVGLLYDFRGNRRR